MKKHAVKWWTVSRSQVSARVGEHQPVFKWALHPLMVFLQGTGEERFLFVQIISFICIKVWKRFEEQISVCGLFPVGCLSNLTPCLHGLQLRRGLAHMPTAMFLWKRFSLKSTKLIQTFSRRWTSYLQPLLSDACYWFTCSEEGGSDLRKLFLLCVRP